ncbi:MAG: hypothetical protein R2844_23905 [Caldilineales bacterium]
MSPASAPANDDFDAATVIGSFPFDTVVDASQATVAADDPDMACGDGVNQRTLWYRLVAPSDGSLTLDTVGSHDDTVVAVWQGSRGSLAGRGCNDDGAYWSETSGLNVTVQAGQTYTVERLRRARRWTMERWRCGRASTRAATQPTKRRSTRS